MSNLNINAMTINNIIDFIRDHLYIDKNNEIIEFDYSFKGNITEFNNIGINNYMNIFKNKFNNYNIINPTNIIIKDNNLYFDIKIINDNNEIYWNIIITENIII